MPWTNSKVFTPFVAAALDRTAAFDLDTDTIKVALYNNTTTPDNTVAIAASAYNTGVWVLANEVDDAAEWPAGGETLASPDITTSGTTITFDGTDVTSTGTSATLANVYGCLVYDDTVSDYGLCYNYFGGAQSVTDGVFTIQWAGTGIASFSVA